MTEMYRLLYDPPVATTFPGMRIPVRPWRLPRSVHAQVVAAIQEEGGAVASVELDQVVTADHPPRVVRHGDDELEDDVLGE